MIYAYAAAFGLGIGLVVLGATTITVGLRIISSFTKPMLRGGALAIAGGAALLYLALH